MENSRAYGCTSWKSRKNPGCGFVIWKREKGHEVTREEAAARLEEARGGRRRATQGARPHGMSPEEVAAHLAEGGAWHYSRASGPGGQRRDHAATRAELTIRPAHLEGLPPDVADRLRERWALDERPLRLTSQAERSRERNRQTVIERLEPARRRRSPAPSPPRRPTRPGRGARERRLATRRGAPRSRRDASPPRPSDRSARPKKSTTSWSRGRALRTCRGGEKGVTGSTTPSASARSNASVPAVRRQGYGRGTGARTTR